MKQAYKELVRNNAVVAAGLIAGQLQNVVLVPLIVRSAGAGIYGSFVLLTSLLLLTSSFSTLGVDFRCRRLLPGTTNHAERAKLFFPAVTFQFIAAALCGTLIALSWSWLGQSLFRIHDPIHHGILAAFMLAYCGFSAFQNYFRYTHRISSMSVSSVTVVLLTLIGVVALRAVGSQLSLERLLWIQIAAYGAVALVLAVMISLEIGIHPSLAARSDYWSDIALGFPIILGTVVEIILASGDRFVIAAFLSPTAVGYYAPAYALGSLILFIPKVSGVVLQPLLSRAVDQGHEADAARLVSYTIRLFLLLGLPFVVGSALLSGRVLTLFANSEVAKAAVLVTPLVAMGTLFYGLMYIASQVFFVRLNTRAIFRANVIATVVNLLMNVVGLYLFRSIVVAAVSTVVSYLAAFVFVWTSLRAEPLLRLEWDSLRKAAFAALAMAVVLIPILRVVDSDGIVSTVLMISIGAVTYAVAVVCLGGVSRKELVFVGQAFGR